MLRLSIFFFLLSVIFNLIYKNLQSENAIQVVIDFNYVDTTGGNASAYQYKDSAYIIYRGVYTIYLKSRKLLSYGISKNDLSVTDSLVSKRKILTARVVKKGDSLGIKYDSLTASSGVFFVVNDFLNDNSIFKGVQISTDNFVKINDSLLQYPRTLCEVYVPISKKDELPDSLYLFYTKEKFANPSFFTKKFHSSSNMNLFKVEYVYNEIRTNYNLLVPSHRTIFQINNVMLPIKDEISELLKKSKL